VFSVFLRNKDPGAETLTAAQLLFSPGVEKPQLHHIVLSGYPSTSSLLSCCGILGSLDKTTVLRKKKIKIKKEKRGIPSFLFTFSIFLLHILFHNGRLLLPIKKRARNLLSFPLSFLTSFLLSFSLGNFNLVSPLITAVGKRAGRTKLRHSINPCSVSFKL